MVRRLVILLGIGCALVGCSHEEAATADMHLGAPTVKPKGVVNEQKDRGMTEETTRGMGEKNIGEKR